MDEYEKYILFVGIRKGIRACHGAAEEAGWYVDPKTGEPLDRNIGEMLCLMHSEISEAMEGYRKNLNDTHLPTYPMITVELADLLIRAFDLAGYLDLDLANAVLDKLDYNQNRADHKLENRVKEGGKKF
jgi:NTP pyrophosphatase (non-canonical NTP hydrolase)